MIYPSKTPKNVHTEEVLRFIRIVAGEFVCQDGLPWPLVIQHVLFWERGERNILTEKSQDPMLRRTHCLREGSYSTNTFLLSCDREWGVMLMELNKLLWISVWSLLYNSLLVYWQTTQTACASKGCKSDIKTIAFLYWKPLCSIWDMWH